MMDMGKKLVWNNCKKEVKKSDRIKVTVDECPPLQELRKIDHLLVERLNQNTCDLKHFQWRSDDRYE